MSNRNKSGHFVTAKSLAVVDSKKKYELKKGSVFHPASEKGPVVLAWHDFKTDGKTFTHSIDGKARAYIKAANWPDYVEANSAAQAACDFSR